MRWHDIASRLQIFEKPIWPETLATSIGGPHATYWPLHRFMNLFGSPNNMGIGQICWNPGIWTSTLTYGWPVENELDLEKTSCAILWGTNLAESDNSLFWRTLCQFRRDGKPMIVVDPRRTRTAAAGGYLAAGAAWNGPGPGFRVAACDFGRKALRQLVCRYLVSRIRPPGRACGAVQTGSGRTNHRGRSRENRCRRPSLCFACSGDD